MVAQSVPAGSMSPASVGIGEKSLVMKQWLVWHVVKNMTDFFMDLAADTARLLNAEWKKMCSSPPLIQLQYLINIMQRMSFVRAWDLIFLLNP